MKKAQWRLLPFLFLAYLIAIVDRLNLSFAAATINKDLGFTAIVYGLAGGIFFVSYALLEAPSNVAMMRFGTRLWITRIMITWGLILRRPDGEFQLCQSGEDHLPVQLPGYNRTGII